ncbi:unnamed protein product [Arctogadus glacialis]
MPKPETTCRQWAHSRTTANNNGFITMQYAEAGNDRDLRRSGGTRHNHIKIPSSSTRRMAYQVALAFFVADKFNALDVPLLMQAEEQRC